MRGRDDAGDPGVERELEDDAPDGGRRGLHGVHQPRRRAVQQEAEQEEAEVDDVQVDGVQRLGRLREVPHDVGGADADDQPGEDRRVLQPRARRRVGHDRRRLNFARAQIDAHVPRPCARGPLEAWPATSRV